MYKMVLDHAGRRTHHVVEASEEGDVRQTHQLGIVDSKTANANIKPPHLAILLLHLKGSTM